MTKEEIKALVASKIEGQGTNLDAASVLPTILNWIIDNMGGAEIPAATEETIGGIRLGYSTLENAVQNKITPFEVRKIPTLGEDYARIGFRTLLAEDIPGSSPLHYTKQQLADFFGISVNLVDDILQGRFAGISIPLSEDRYLYMPLSHLSSGDTVMYGVCISSEYAGSSLTIIKQSEDAYDILWREL